MPVTKRLRIGAMALVGFAAIATAGRAGIPQILSASDAHRYAAAFAATERGDFIGAKMQMLQVRDTSLAGYLSFKELMHPTAHRAAFDELATLLEKFRDQIGRRHV